MAIEHTRTLQRIEVSPDGVVTITYFDLFDDPDDDMLPTTAHKIITLHPHQDVSKHQQFVQDVCSGAWLNIDPINPVPAEVPEGAQVN